jgi:hypothetical protein
VRPGNKLPRALVALGVILVVLVGAYLLGGGSSDPTTADGSPSPTARSTPRSTATPRATARPTAQGTVAPTAEPTVEVPTRYAAGDTAHLTVNGDPWADITVTGVKTVAKYNDPDGFLDDVPDPGNVYIQAFVTYEAIANGVDYNPFDWAVFVDGVAVGNYAFVLNGPTPDLPSGTLPAGRKAAGWLVYEIPSAGEVLLSYLANTFSDDPPIFEVVLRNG